MSNSLGLQRNRVHRALSRPNLLMARTGSWF